MKQSNSRWIALQLLLRLVERGRSLDDGVNSDWFRSLPAAPRDLALSRELAFGVCRWYHAMLPLLHSRLQKPMRARDRDVELILLIGLYQLLVIGTEAHAAVNETVKLAAMQNKGWARGLINALLRGLIREGLEGHALDPRAAYPDWIRARIDADWGELADSVLEHGNARPPMVLRVDLMQLSRERMLEMLDDEDIEAVAMEQVDSAIRLTKPCDVSLLPGFADGRVSVQDGAAQLAATLHECRSGARVLDACAAPGGKTLHWLQVCPGIELDALDVDAGRLERVAQNLSRAGLSARLLTGDASNPAEWHDGREYDAMLVDVPCSASGVIRRHPDIKLLRRESDILRLQAGQAEILDALWPLLARGGKLLYCTCSLFKDENETQISRFLERTGDAVELDLGKPGWGQARPHGRQILPDGQQMDGFYYALLQKRDDA